MNHKNETKISFVVEDANVKNKIEGLEAFLGQHFDAFHCLETQEKQSVIAPVVPQVKDPEVACAGLLHLSTKESFFVDFTELCSFFGAIDTICPELKNIQEISTRHKTTKGIWNALLEQGKTKQFILDLFQKTQNAQILIHNKDFLTHTISNFLVPLPFTKEYERVAFAQKMVRTYLDLGQLLSQPQLVNGALQRAFQEYKKRYIECFENDYKAYKNEVESFCKEKKNIEKELLALAALDKLSELGAAESHKITPLFDSFFASHPQEKSDVSHIREQIQTYGQYKDFYLGKKPETAEFKRLQHLLREKLTEKLSKLQEKSVLKVIQRPDEESINKVIDLISLSKIEELVTILAKDKDGEIIFALRKIFF